MSSVRGCLGTVSDVSVVVSVEIGVEGGAIVVWMVVATDVGETMIGRATVFIYGLSVVVADEGAFVESDREQRKRV
jgi:hypothetical protein